MSGLADPPRQLTAKAPIDRNCQWGVELRHRISHVMHHGTGHGCSVDQALLRYSRNAETTFYRRPVSRRTDSTALVASRQPPSAVTGSPNPLVGGAFLGRADARGGSYHRFGNPGFRISLAIGDTTAPSSRTRTISKSSKVMMPPRSPSSRTGRRRTPASFNSR